MIGKRIEYQTGWGCYGIGIVTAVSDETGVVTVRDDEDGTFWKGSPEQIEFWDDDAI